MKYVLLIALVVTLVVPTAFADRRGSPFHPHDDKRFDEIEDQLEDTTEAVGLARKSARFVYDVAVDGGESTSHSLGVVIPAGSIITAVHLFINTLFADSGTGSVALGCGGNRDLMNWKDLTLISASSVSSAVYNATSFGTGNSVMDLGNLWSVADTRGASVTTACTVTAVVRSDAGHVEQTAGKLTGIIEYFSR